MSEEIKKESFYDVQQRPFCPEELYLYRDLAGMPLFESYQELIRALGSSKTKCSAENKSLQKKPNERRTECNKKY